MSQNRFNKIAWVSVEDSLPKKPGRYLVFHEKYGEYEDVITSAVFTYHGFTPFYESSKESFWGSDITHWSHFPNLPPVSQSEDTNNG